MKKFVFTLETLSRVKESEKMQREGLLVKAQRALDELKMQRKALQERLDGQNQIFRARMLAGVNGEELRVFNNHKTYLAEAIERLTKGIEKAALERDACRNGLVETMKETKTLEKLREKQYELYLEEVRREEEKSVGDFVAFQITRS